MESSFFSLFFFFCVLWFMDLWDCQFSCSLFPQTYVQQQMLVTADIQIIVLVCKLLRATSELGHLQCKYCLFVLT